MTTFLDKLKKGMGAEEPPSFAQARKEGGKEKPELEEILQEAPVEEEKPTENEPGPEPEEKKEKEPIKKRTPKKRVKKEKTIKKEKEIEFKKIEVDEESSSFAQARKEGSKEEKWLGSNGQLTVDVYQTDKDFIVRSAIAGVQAKDLNISIDNDMLIIEGRREKPAEEGGVYSYQECFWGPFSREIVLPEEIDCSRIKVSLKEGILTIRIPKVQRRTNEKITIE